MSAPRAAPRGFLARAASALLILMTLVCFVISAMTLSYFGVKYDEAGGSALHKLHPASWIACLALMATFAARRDRIDWIAGLPARFPGAALFTGSWITIILFAQIVQHTPLMPLVDTFFCALVFLVLWEDADCETRNFITVMLHVVLVGNALIGIGEFVTHKRLTPFVTGGREVLYDYRSTALLGHPLLNAGTTGGYMLMMIFGGDRAVSLLPRLAIIGVCGVALVAFGGRTAIVMSIALTALGSIMPILRTLAGARFDLRGALAFSLVVPLAVGVLAFAYASGSLDQLIERFTDDKGSAEARVLMLQLFSHFTWEELFFGPDPVRLEGYMRL
ncbi:MAG: VpsF family polysaccharide biosynthesis protein, partial [Hyphomicrobiales bacterium]|nr:VpsF family polysaccharide biosynthesis protein [Hyphomicrobiales bacterium]